MSLQKEYSRQEFDKLPDEILDVIFSEPGWVIKDGKILKVSDEEYKESLKNWNEENKGSIDGETI